MGHVTHMNESCRTYEWGMAHTGKSHVAHTNETCRTYECDRHVARMNAACRTFTWGNSCVWTVMSHMWMRPTCRTYECSMSHIWMRYVAHMNATCRTYTWSNSCVWRSPIADISEACHSLACYLRVDIKITVKTYTYRRHVTHMTHMPESRRTREFYLRVDIDISVHVAGAVEVQPCTNDKTL